MKNKNKLELIARACPMKMRALHDLHDEDLFYSGVGKNLIVLRNYLYDLDEYTELSERFLADIDLNAVTEQVLPMIREIQYIKTIVAAIKNKDHSCKVFSHFIENLDKYIEHSDWNLAWMLKQHKHLLNTIYYKQEIEHFDKIVYDPDQVEKLIKKFGDRAVDALHHFVESHSTKPEEKLLAVCDKLNKRIVRLDKAAKRNCKRILNSEIRRLEKNFAKIKEQSAKVIEEGIKHYKKVSEVYDRLLL